MAQSQELVEGRTGTLPDGTRVIVRNGQVVPLSSGGGEAPGARLLPRGRATGDRRSEEAYWGRRRTQGDPAVTQAEQGVSASRRAEGLLRRQEQQGQGTGGIYGVPILGTVAGYLDPEIRELNALQSRQARLERQPGEGAISDFDAAQFVAMTYGADKPMETNRALIQAQRVVNDATLQKREFDEWFFQQYGTTAGSQEAWRVYAQENPIFDPASQQEGSARLNDRRLNWRQYFTGEGGLDTQASLDARNASTVPSSQQSGRTDLVGPDTDANSLPNYPSIERMTAGVTGGMDTPVEPGPDKPGSSEANPISIVDVSPDELLKALSNGGYVRYPDGRVEKVAGATRGQAVEGATPVAPGVTRNPDVPAMERTDPFSVAVRNIAAFGQGAAEQVPFVDEAAAYAASRLTGIDYDTAREVQALASDADRRERPLARNAGGLAGFGATFLAPGGVALKAGQPILNTARLAGAGAATGAVYGAGQGEGDISERGQNALEGAAIGAVAGPTVNALARPVVNAARPLAQFGGRQIGGLAERIGIPGAGRLVQASTPNALASSVDRLPRMDANALAARADELDALGIDPAFIDVVDDARQGTFRALNTRDTPARETATRLAETRRRNLPSRVRNIAEQEVSAESRPTLEVIDELSKTRRTNAETGMADFGQNAVRLNENAIQAVRSDLVKGALRDAAVRAQASLDPVERAAANRLNQLADTALDNPAQAQLTVREAQDISAALNAAAEGAFRSNTPANGPVLRDLGRAIRQSARDSSEGYDNWLRQYADDSQLMEAATTGRNFVQADVNPIGARSTDAFVRQAQQATPPELMVQQAAARQAMEAQGAGPTGARGVLESFASNEDQYRRAGALGLDADRLRARGEAELRMVQNAQNNSPRVGSQTATNMADQVGEAAGLAGAAMRGDLPGVVGRLGRRIMSRGFSDKQAEAISMAAMDPMRTREIIDLLATKMSRQDARSLLRSIRFAASRGAGEYAGEE